MQLNMKAIIVGCAVALTLTLPASATAENNNSCDPLPPLPPPPPDGVIWNNGIPDNIDGISVRGISKTANDFSLTAPPCYNMRLDSFDWWVRHNGITTPTVTSSFFWEILSNAGGMPGDEVIASGTVTDATGVRTPEYGTQTYFFNTSLGGVTLGNGIYWLAISAYTSDAPFPQYTWRTSAQSGNQMNSFGDPAWEDLNDEGRYEKDKQRKDICSPVERNNSKVALL